ncbi:MAG TPA: hypothetical protein VJ801_09070 [Polyangia bacterium]|nr:hypothetical protein [Polyangia bacterium]
MSSDSGLRGSTGKRRREAKPDAPLSHEPSQVQTDAPPRPERCNVLILSFLSFFLIGFGVWVVSAGSRYREEYAQAMEGWRVGSTRVVELTLVREDKRNLECASDQVIAGLRCGNGGESHEAGRLPADNPQILQPYNTVGNELLLGAGLWSSPDLKEPLPQARFTVVCTYHIEGVMRSALTRFDPAGSFAPLGKTATVGTLTDCMLPR